MLKKCAPWDSEGSDWPPESFESVMVESGFWFDPSRRCWSNGMCGFHRDEFDGVNELRESIEKLTRAVQDKQVNRCRDLPD